MATGDERESLAGSPPPSTNPATLRIGSAGFHYPDWAGVVFPRSAATGPRALAALARWMDLVEINVSHYRIPPPRTAHSWLATTASRPSFRFTAKLWRGWTHDDVEPGDLDRAAMRDFLSALASDGRLEAVLAQFPPFFRATDENAARVARLAQDFREAPLAVEFRHVSWDDDARRRALADAGVAWTIGDWTPGPGWIEPRALVTAPLSYVRLHGRNPSWYAARVGRDRRYDYLYGRDELARWAERIRTLRAAASSVVVVANNHYGGQGVANALELKAILSGDAVPGPSSIVRAFPRLEGLVVPDDAGLRESRVDPTDQGWFNP
jgi:uncharacterized protein YecE (DUF72 family)